jgi:hypothetical protein
MTIRIRLSATVWLVTATVVSIIGCTAIVSASEDDAVQKLVGRWEGTSLTARNEQRFLKIDSVRRDGDRWIGDGRWGTAGNNGIEVKMNVTVAGDDVSLQFTAGADNIPVRLKLTNDTELNGTIQVRTKGRRLEDAPLKLTKVQS